MKLFERFLKPKWKSTNPEIRKQAIINLDKNDNQSILVDIAENDDVPEIRQIAIKRINSIQSLIQISTQTSDKTITDTVNKILVQKIISTNDTELDENQKLDIFNKLVDAKSIESVAEKSDSFAIKLAAINKISRESLLGDIAIKDRNPEIRQLAASRLSQKSTLERVYKGTKTKDKTISKIVKQKISDIQKEEEKPRVLLENQKQICLNLESLGDKGLWERDKVLFDKLTQQWLKLTEENDTLPLQNRFKDASDKFSKGFDAYLLRNAERLKKEAELQPVIEAKKSVITALLSLIEQIPDSEDANEWFQQTLLNITKLKEQWVGHQTLPEDIESDLKSQFVDAYQQLENVIGNYQKNHYTNKVLAQIKLEISKQLERPFKIKSSIVNKNQSKYNALTTNTLLDNALANEVKQLLSKASQTIELNSAKAEALIKKTNTKLEQLEKHLTDGALKEVNHLHKEIQANIKNLGDISNSKLDGIKNRLAKNTSKIQDLNKWRSWANTPQKELLIEKVQALIGSSIEPKEIAFIISQARKDWKKLGPSEQSTSQALWEKFNEYCNTAYEPCKEVFAEEAKSRKENFVVREKFLADLEEFIEKADWNKVNWTKVENLYRQSRQEWQELGQADREKRGPLNKQFNKLHSQLKTRLNEEWEKNLAVKKIIVEESKALLDVEDIDSATNQSKQLQVQWKNAGRIPHYREKELWAEFRHNCDKVFNRRQVAIDQKKSKEQDLVNQKETLFSEIEKICQLPITEIEKSATSLKEHKLEFSKISTNKQTDSALQKKLSQNLEIYTRKIESLELLKNVHNLLALKEKVSICETIEKLLPDLETETSAELEKKFGELEPLKINSWEDAINSRFNRLNKFDPTTYKNECDTNLEKIQHSTIQLEIIADIDTPENASNKRMEIQAERLANKLKNRTEENQWESFVAAEANWLSIGPIDSNTAQTFKDRHNKILSALKQAYPELLNDYN